MRIVDRNGQPLAAEPRPILPGAPQHQIDLALSGIGPAGVGLLITVDGTPYPTMMPAAVARQLGVALIGLAHQHDSANQRQHVAEGAGDVET